MRTQISSIEDEDESVLPCGVTYQCYALLVTVHVRAGRTSRANHGRARVDMDLMPADSDLSRALAIFTWAFK